MSAPLALRPLLLSLIVVLAGTASVLSLPPLAGSPSVILSATDRSTTVAAPPADPVPLPPQARPAPAVGEEVLDVLRQQRAAGLDCVLSAGNAPICVHGDDGRPASRHVAGSAGGSTPTSGQVGCYGTGSDGPRVQAVYARAQGAPDRFASSVGSIRGWAAGVSRQFDDSARRTGGRRHVRFATTAGAGCVVTVLNVVLPDPALRTFQATVDALEARGLDAPSSKYLVWADTHGFCGLATTFADDSPRLDNLNNGRVASYARIDRACWGRVEAHELVHMLGGVQPSARNSTGGFHCNDGLDVMCYDDGTARSHQRSVCGAGGGLLLDCRTDDYFSTAAPAGSYLQTHWNVARSSFLAVGLTEPAPSSKPSPAAPPPASPSPSPTSASPAPPGPDEVRELLRPLREIPPLPVAVPSTLTAVLG